VLTFSRRAAGELRERIAARLGRTSRGALAMTFHSYAFALLRRELAAAGGPPLRLLSGPEQDLEVARLLAGELEDGALGWPEQLRPSLALRGFRRELRDLLQRAQERGVDGRALRALGAAADRPEWRSAGDFLDAYEGRFALDPSAEVLDHSGLVRAAAGLLERDDELRARERAARAVVLVDEYQDTDPAQVRLLQALAGEGRDLVAVGDPDQSIYAFRGADVRGILGFPDAFRTVTGERAPVVELRTCRRSGPALLAASRSVARRLPASGLTRDFRDLRADPSTVRGPGVVEVRLASSPTGEAALVADVLRRAHLHDGLPWSSMAVLLRSTPRSLAVLRRGLLSAGVPVGVPADEVPLVEEPVVRALLDLLLAALRPAAVTPELVLSLLGGPLVRATRSRSAGCGAACARWTSPAAADPVRRAAGRGAARPAGAAGGPRAGPPPMDALHRLTAAVQAAADGGSAEQVLWSAWEASRLAGRLEHDSLSGGSRGAVADRALDAVLALFDAACPLRRPAAARPGARLRRRRRRAGGPGDTLAQRTPEGDSVAVMTAHASKGLEWPLVVVAGGQEGVWPDLRLRGSLLGADDVAALAEAREAGGSAVDRRAELLAEERRLFYVAVTRAKERLVVTAVAGDEGEDRPEPVPRGAGGGACRTGSAPSAAR
jgi:superfamily I DNA/RNA helicase